MAPHNTENLELQLNKVAIAFLVVSWVFILLRIWTRTVIRPNFGWDDATMVLAGAIFAAYCGCIMYIESNGGGTHVTDFHQLSILTKWTIASESAYVATVMVVKISLSILFARIVVKRWQLHTIYLAVAVSSLSATAAFFFVLFRCGPSLDDYAMKQYLHQCTSRPVDRFFAYEHASFALVTDCIFAILPIPILWNTNMTRRAKISIGFILSLGALGCICSIIRFRYVDGLTQLDDFFWNSANVSVWSTIEAGTGIIAGCLATLRPLFQRIFTHARATTTSSSTSAAKSQSQSSGSSKRTHSTRQDSAAAPMASGAGGGHVDKELQAIEHRELDEWDQITRKESSRRESTECILLKGGETRSEEEEYMGLEDIDLERGDSRYGILGKELPPLPQRARMDDASKEYTR